jgi:hypothetical protein
VKMSAADVAKFINESRRRVTWKVDPDVEFPFLVGERFADRPRDSPAGQGPKGKFQKKDQISTWLKTNMTEDQHDWRQLKSRSNKSQSLLRIEWKFEEIDAIPGWFYIGGASRARNPALICAYSANNQTHDFIILINARHFLYLIGTIAVHDFAITPVGISVQKLN